MKGKRISVLGCGWLGLPLAEKLINEGFEVKGSTTTQQKVVDLEEKGIQPFLIDLDDINAAVVTDFLFNSDVLIINIPPRRKVNSVSSYSKVLANLLQFVELNLNQKIIFVSSTSVYKNTNALVDEDVKPQPETESAKAVLKAENILKSNLTDRLTVVRFAGLIGENRHPGKFLAGRKGLSNATAPINMIHQKDCIGLIIKVIEKDFWGEVINGVASKHPSRKEFYTKATRSLGLEEPSFLEEDMATFKLISNSKSVERLGYTYLYDNPIGMI